MNYQAPSSASELANGSYVLDLDIHWRDMTLIEVNNTEDSMVHGIYRTPGKRGSMVLQDFELFIATYETKYLILPIVYSKFIVKEKIAAISIELRSEEIRFSTIPHPQQELYADSKKA